MNDAGGMTKAGRRINVFFEDAAAVGPRQKCLSRSGLDPRAHTLKSADARRHSDL
jgi:hypothetical protein